jgi:two-component system chemotaxis response regulator CheY
MGGRILVVDDDEPIRELVAEILREDGYEVTEARNGAQGLRCLDSGGTFELVMLDMRMPVLDGWQFAAAVTERGLGLPIVVMTAAQDARQWAEEINAAGYIAKPFGIDDLAGVVHRVLESRRQPRDNPDSLIQLMRRLARSLESGQLGRRSAT